MKPFDLQEALNGAPINVEGEKCYVLRDVTDLLDNPKETRYLVVFPSNHTDAELWPEDYFEDSSMWEEPELTSEQVLEKAFNEGLFVAQSANCQIKLKVIAKAKDGVFVLEADNGFMSKSVDGEYVLYKDPAPKSDTITVTLPKPFKPEQGQAFYFSSMDGELIVSHFDKNSALDCSLKSYGKCFRTRGYAKAWLDAMKNALDD